VTKISGVHRRLVGMILTFADHTMRGKFENKKRKKACRYDATRISQLLDPTFHACL